ncbi:MAG: hypothetical protein IPP02_07770 [Chitinophagaceae bacterium]|jgi:hypothetical protein|nr:hypothetical protein [Chitinophagaceae bacterium]MBK7680829.1 hypothetical protein [Chitinophagaceae bacterium]MBK8300924.1 hypothetical protein [Chitinophagaceae bacterium]MBK9465244.1 hypothetical protein [Chitinophagaceae bacterium]MBK9660388.1 hypothetical protein [Chitinophagaceae bacterium]
MNTSTSVLWELIQNMNRNEKLYFKRKGAVSAGVKHPLYIKLFDTIAKQSEYDEAAIIKKLSPKITKKNIAFQKHYLHSQLNNCLIEYENRNNVEQEIYRSIQLIRINRKKGLLNEALVLWKRTINKAREVELFSMSQLLKKEFEKMILFSSVQVKYDELYTLFSSNIMSYDEYAEMITLRDLYTEILMLKRKAHFDFDEELKTGIRLLQEKILNRKAGLQSPSFWFRHYTRMCHATLQYLLDETDSSLPLLQQAVQDWWKHKNFIETDTEHYIELLYMVNYAGVRQGAYPYVEFVFNDPINDLISDDVQKANFDAVKYLALNKVYHKTARYPEVAKLVGNMKRKYTRWESLLNAELNRTVCFSLGISCFVLDNFTESLQFIKRGVTYFKDGTREEQFIFANLFLLLIQYNINNTKLFDAQYKSTYAYFYRKGKNNSFEKTLMHCFHDTFYLTSYKEKSILFQKAIKELDSNLDSDVQKQTLNIFNFHGWLLSQVQRISYKDYVQKKYNQETREEKQSLTSV